MSHRTSLRIAAKKKATEDKKKDNTQSDGNDSKSNNNNSTAIATFMTPKSAPECPQSDKDPPLVLVATEVAEKDKEIAISKSVETKAATVATDDIEPAAAISAAAVPAEAKNEQEFTQKKSGKRSRKKQAAVVQKEEEDTTDSEVEVKKKRPYRRRTKSVLLTQFETSYGSDSETIEKEWAPPPASEISESEESGGSEVKEKRKRQYRSKRKSKVGTSDSGKILSTAAGTNMVDQQVSVSAAAVVHNDQEQSEKEQPKKKPRKKRTTGVKEDKTKNPDGKEKRGYSRKNKKESLQVNSSDTTATQCRTQDADKSKESTKIKTPPASSEKPKVPSVPQPYVVPKGASQFDELIRDVTTEEFVEALDNLDPDTEPEDRSQLSAPDFYGDPFSLTVWKLYSSNHNISRIKEELKCDWNRVSQRLNDKIHVDRVIALLRKYSPTFQAKFDERLSKAAEAKSLPISNDIQVQNESQSEQQQEQQQQQTEEVKPKFKVLFPLLHTACIQRTGQLVSNKPAEPFKVPTMTKEVLDEESGNFIEISVPIPEYAGDEDEEDPRVKVALMIPWPDDDEDDNGYSNDNDESGLFGDNSSNEVEVEVISKSVNNDDGNKSDKNIQEEKNDKTLTEPAPAAAAIPKTYRREKDSKNKLETTTTSSSVSSTPSTKKVSTDNNKFPAVKLPPSLPIAKKRTGLPLACGIQNLSKVPRKDIKQKPKKPSANEVKVISDSDKRDNDELFRTCSPPPLAPFCQIKIVKVVSLSEQQQPPPTTTAIAKASIPSSSVFVGTVSKPQPKVKSNSKVVSSLSSVKKPATPQQKQTPQVQPVITKVTSACKPSSLTSSVRKASSKGGSNNSDNHNAPREKTNPVSMKISNPFSLGMRPNNTHTKRITATATAVSNERKTGDISSSFGVNPGTKNRSTEDKSGPGGKSPTTKRKPGRPAGPKYGHAAKKTPPQKKIKKDPEPVEYIIGF